MKNIKQINGVPHVLGNVYMLATEDNSNIFKRGYLSIMYSYEKPLLYITNTTIIPKSGKYQHIYITDDSTVNVGEWYIILASTGYPQEVRKADYNFSNQWSELFITKYIRKIIATTNPMLLPFGFVQSKIKKISQEFIKDYCDNGGIDKVWIKCIQNGYCVKCKKLKYNHLCKCGEQDNFNYKLEHKVNDNNEIETLHIEDNVTIDIDKLCTELERLRSTSDEELRIKFPLKSQVGYGIDWNKWIEEIL